MDPRLKQQYLLYIQQHRQRGPNLNHTNQSHATHPHVNHVSSNHSGPNPSPQQQHHQQGQTRHTVPQVRITSACDQNESSQVSIVIVNFIFSSLSFFFFLIPILCFA